MTDQYELVEKVALAIEVAEIGDYVGYRDLAIAAIEAIAPLIRAEALEEAAKLADTKADEWATVWRNRFKCDSHMEGKSDGADEIAVAIRAMKEKTND